ncbi:hypothetical protein [Umezawaea sp. Da 62-37]|uniref:hypothetical protein n=1 Tax=Umezawaea sp. Da 62-37 TaxID=3075927 RepID=UPI0028F6DC8C|nr:hypothetical protein [Umezawaea sp. Da 62-37]WNV86668.1 hypothetical protein RM788_52575 [Umezawaea sp. Da 62-37]WNV86749.1 hypothetical protein RM788_00230 [Umezawaea sp. Da 62-37]
MELVELLYRLREEGGFTLKDVVKRWAETDPEGAATARVVPKPDVVAPQRITELMQMRRGLLPTSLIKVFLELWIQNTTPGSVARKTTIDTLERLRHRAGKYEEQHRADTGTPHPSRNDQRRLSEEIGQLKDKLITAQADLLRTCRDKEQLEKLTVFLVYAVQRLSAQYGVLLDERNALAAAQRESDTGSTAVLAERTRQVGDRLVRAEHQLARTREEVTQLAVLAEDLKRLLLALTARLDDAQSISTAPLAKQVDTEGAQDPDPVGLQMIAETDSALDRVEDMLQTSSDNRAVVRRHLTDTSAEEGVTSDDGGAYPPPSAEPPVTVVSDSGPPEALPGPGTTSGIVRPEVDNAENPPSGDDAGSSPDNPDHGRLAVQSSADDPDTTGDSAARRDPDGSRGPGGRRPRDPDVASIDVVSPTTPPIGFAGVPVEVLKLRRTPRSTVRKNRTKKIVTTLLSTVLLSSTLTKSENPNIEVPLKPTPDLASPQNPIPDAAAGVHTLYPNRHSIKDVHGDVVEVQEFNSGYAGYFFRWNLNDRKGGKVTFTLNPDSPWTVSKIRSYVYATPLCAGINVEVSFKSSRVKVENIDMQPVDENFLRSALTFTGMNGITEDTVTISAFDVSGGNCHAAFYWGPLAGRK